MGLRYRTLQFLSTLRDKPDSAGLQLAREHLPASLMSLFENMTPADQAHSIRVCQSLLKQGQTDRDLLAAALLHDVGKSLVTPSIWERVLIVLANQIAPGRVLKWSEAEPHGWKRPFVIAHRHPEWGAGLVADNGGSKTLVQLIQHHQTRPVSDGEALAHQLSLLQAADSEN
jgi:hypothetical protein